MVLQSRELGRDGVPGLRLGLCLDPSAELPTRQVMAIAEYRGQLYVGGQFAWAGAKLPGNIARWDE